MMFSASVWHLFLSFSFYLSIACQSWIHWLYSAAILVTQLTTPYLRIAPAAGDNQLTGQTGSFTHGSKLWKQTSCTCVCVRFCLLLHCLQKKQRDSIKDSQTPSPTFISSGHERPVSGGIVIWCDSNGDFLRHLILFMNISHYLWKIKSCFPLLWQHTKKMLKFQECRINYSNSFGSSSQRSHLKYSSLSDIFSVRLACNRILGLNQFHQSRQDC